MSLSNAYHSSRMRSGPSAFTLRVLLRHENCAGGQSGNWTMTLPPPGGWTRRGPRQIMRRSSLFTSRIQGCAYGSRRNVSIASSKAGRGRTTPGERVKSGFGDAVGISVAFVISCQGCASRCMACARSLSRFFYRGRYGQESEEDEEDREGSHQESGKEDLKEKEVVAPPRLRHCHSRSQPGCKAKPLQRI